jgi:hypothetical protein
MSQPFPGIPDPGARPPIRRRTQPGAVHLEMVRQVCSNGLRKTRRYGRDLCYQAQRHGQPLWYRGKRYSRDLWLHGKRHPRAFGLIGSALVLTLVGAYTLSASGAGRSLCPPPIKGKTIQFSLLMDPVPHSTAGSELEIHYDVCGLPSGTPYHGRAKLSQQKPAAKRTSQPKPLVVAFRDKVDGLATRRNQEMDLTYTRPGTYSLELLVVDNKGRERKKTQKIVIQAR